MRLHTPLVRCAYTAEPATLLSIATEDLALLRLPRLTRLLPLNTNGQSAMATEDLALLRLPC